jgi:hypothetical protein
MKMLILKPEWKRPRKILGTELKDNIKIRKREMVCGVVNQI